jgi:Zn-finger protein
MTDCTLCLEVFYKLTKRAEGTYIKGHRGVLSDYMCTINNLIKHVRFHRD